MNSCTSKPTTIIIFKFINYIKLYLRLFFYYTELADAIILVDNSMLSSICRELPNIIITTIRFINNQLCYPKGFLSFSSYTLSLYKLGVHFHGLHADMSDTLGRIIFIHLLRSTVLLYLYAIIKVTSVLSHIYLKDFTDFAR